MFVEGILVTMGFAVGLYWYLFNIKILWQSVQAFKMFNEMPPLGKPPKEIADAIEKAMKRNKKGNEDNKDAGMFQ